MRTAGSARRMFLSRTTPGSCGRRGSPPCRRNDKRGMDDEVERVDAELVRLGYRPGAGDVAEDTRSVPVAETSRALPKEPRDEQQQGNESSSSSSSSETPSFQESEQVTYQQAPE